MVSTEALATVWPALAAAAAVGMIGAALLWRGGENGPAAIELGNPMELKPALFFAALLAIITLAANFAAAAFGESGLYGVGIVSGLADVDAVTLAVGEKAGEQGVTAAVAGSVVLAAVASNIVFKGAMAASVGGLKVGARVAAAFAMVIAAGAAAIIWL
ncbi:MAG: DUF4010 domain-containing protein [Parvularculaceae bacterium]